MTDKNTIEQLESLIIDRKLSLYDGGKATVDTWNMWRADIEAVTIAIEAVKKIEKIKAIMHNAGVPNWYGEYTTSPEDEVIEIEDVIYDRKTIKDAF